MLFKTTKIILNHKRIGKRPKKENVEIEFENYDDQRRK